MCKDWQGLWKPGNHWFPPRADSGHIFQNQIHLPPSLLLSSWLILHSDHLECGSWSMWCLLVASAQLNPLLLSPRPSFHPLPTSQTRWQVPPPLEHGPVSSILQEVPKQSCREEPNPRAPSQAQGFFQKWLHPYCLCPFVVARNCSSLPRQKWERGWERGSTGHSKSWDAE